VIPGDIVELRIAIRDVGDSSYDSLAVLDGFQWLTDATLPGTGNRGDRGLARIALKSRRSEDEIR
jgi:hypothetical protein